MRRQWEGLPRMTGTPSPHPSTRPARRHSSKIEQLSLFYTPPMYPGDDGTGLAWFLAQIFRFSLQDPVRFMKADFSIRKS